MKRDLSLIRELLLSIEDTKEPPGSSALCADKDDTEKSLALEYLRLMEKAGLVSCIASTPISGSWRCAELKLTWEGHDYLDAVRDPEVWKRTKDGAGAVGGLALGAVKDMATAYAKHVVKEKLGLDL